MGIPGLTSFMKRNFKKYFKTHQLKDTLIIIDGSACTHYLYEHENYTNEFLGDYDVIAKTYINFVNLLLRCKVTPIFVFDGALEQRKVEKVMLCRNQDLQSYGRQSKPLFFGNILYNILNDMDIPLIKCDFEADSEIVALAKLLNCPVISRDSDFYINIVPYIPLDMIILDLKSTENVINCHIYKVERLLNDFGGLKTEYLPLVAAMLGNDYIRTDTFSTLLRLKPGTFHCGLKLQRITDWLRNQKNVDSAIDNMTNYFIDYNDYIKNQIKRIVEEYNSINSKYLAFILQYKNMSKYQNSLNNYLKSNEKSILPQWLEQNYRRGIISGDVMTILKLKKIFFKIQPEDYKLPPYYEVSLKIIKRILGLLSEENDLVFGIGRKNGLNRVDHQFLIEPYKTNHHVLLADLNQIDLSYRKKVILDLIGVEKIIGFPKEWELFIVIVIYWAIHTNNCKTSHMHALIVSAMTINIIKKNNASHDSTDKTKSIIEENVTKEDCIKALTVLSKYFSGNQHNDCMNLHYKIIHPFSQFLSCANYIMMLNSLLDFPYNQCRIEYFFNGSFLYNLCISMKNCNPEIFVLQLLDSNNMDSLNKIYKSIINYIDELISKVKVEN